MRTTLKQGIRTEIKNLTYEHCKNLDFCFRDFIYGDEYYITLEDVIYRFLTDSPGSEFNYTFGNIDIIVLVSDLLACFIKTDIRFKQKYSQHSERHRKNYIMKALLNASKPLLIKQLKENEVIAQDLNDLNRFKELRCISIYNQDGKLLEDLSYKRWQKHKNEQDIYRMQKKHLYETAYCLNSDEQRIVYLVLENKTYSEIAAILDVDHGKIRKVLYSAKEKLKKKIASLN